MLYREIKEEKLERIKDIFREDDNVHMEFDKTYDGRLFVYPKENSYAEMYVKIGYKNRFVIARMCVEHKGRGIGAKILNVIKDYCREEDIKEILIESVLTNDMVRFCEKHGFKPMTNYTQNMDGKILGNYILKL